MVSLSSPRTHGPLVTRLAASPRPALRQDPAPDAGGGHGRVDQRIELSGAVVVNWAAKAAGLLLDEGVGPGDTVLVDLPDHWLSRALALGVLVSGARLDPASGAPSPAEDAAAAAVLTDRPQAWGDPAMTVVSVRLPRGLEPDFGDGAADPSVVDLAAEIRAQPDTLPGPVDHVTPDAVPATGPGPGHGEGEGRARLGADVVHRTLRDWDAGRCAVVPA